MDAITPEERAAIDEAIEAGIITHCPTGAHAEPIGGAKLTFKERRRQMYREFSERGKVNRARKNAGTAAPPTRQAWFARHSERLNSFMRGIVG